MHRLDTQKIIPLLRETLEANPEGVKEYDLITMLNKRSLLPDDASLTANLRLFTHHFIVFHCLYLLGDQYIKTQSGHLHIDVILIRLHPYTRAGTAIGKTDEKLRLYYLDLKNLKTTNDNDVEALLQSFWERYIRQDHRGNALATLGLCDPVSDEQIRQTYRSLAMEHHPDRGGDEEKLKEINEAYRLLRPHSALPSA